MKPTRILFFICTAVVANASAYATTELGIVTPNDGVTGDQFGYSVDVDGDLMAVGASFADIDSVEKQGAVYIYERNASDQWQQIRKITSDDGVAFDQFGFSVGISSNVVVVGAEEAPIGANSSQGAAYVFERDDGGANNWGQVKKLEAPTSVGNIAEYGHSIDIDGDTVIVGSPKAGSGGQAFVYQRNEGGADNWGQVKVLVDDIFDSNAGFGTGVAIDGDSVVVGAESLDMNPGSFNNERGAYVFGRNEGGNNNWGQIQKLFASDAGGNDRFGRGVAIDDSIIVIGGWSWDSTESGQGQAYVYTNEMVRGPGSWTEIATIVASDGAAFDFYGRAVAAIGNTAISTSSSHDAGRGKAYRYDADEGGAGNWGESDQLTASDAAMDNLLGSAVAVTSGYIVVGASGNGPGAVYVYEGPTVTGSPDTDGDGLSDDSDNCLLVANPAQRDTDADSIGNFCDPDIALPNDCFVNFLDLTELSNAFFATPVSPSWNPDADINGDDVINFLDLNIVRTFFFASPGPSGLVNACE